MRQPQINLSRTLREWATGKTELTPEARLGQMYTAQRLRNWIFGLAVPPLDGVPVVTSRFRGVSVNNTPGFAHDLVIADLIATDSTHAPGSTPELGAQFLLTGNPSVYIEDLFGAGQFLPPHFLMDTNPQNAGLAPPLGATDPTFRALGFVPRLIKAGQTIQARWSVDTPNGMSQSIWPVTAFWSVYALCQDEPYACPSGDVARKCEGFVKSNPREPYILDLRISPSSFPAAERERTYRFEPQERPLLLFGVASNLSGCQIKLRDEAKQHEFTTLYKSAPGAFTEMDGTLFQSPGWVTAQPEYLPINLFAPAANDGFVGAAYKWFPVPHFLEPNTSLVVTLKNGLRQAGGTQNMNVSASLAAPGHIAFSCLTL